MEIILNRKIIQYYNRKDEEIMTEPERIRVKKKHEMRTKDISKMIDEGGLGADKYYDIEKKIEAEKKKKQDKENKK